MAIVITTDPIADMLTRIRNALERGMKEVSMPSSKLKESLAKVLVLEGWLQGAEPFEEDNRKYLKLVLKYDQEGNPVISGLRRVSKPGLRIYSKSGEIPKVSFGMGATIVSTSRGIMTDKQARQQKVGGEVICQIW